MCRKCGGSAVLVLVMHLFGETAARAQDQRPTVIVYVYNNANAPESIMAETGGYVREMFQKAGIELVWLDSMARLRAGQADSFGTGRGEGTTVRVSVVIVPRPDIIAPEIRNLEGRMGWTAEGQHTRTYIFYKRVEAFVLNNFGRIYTLRVPRVLTYVIAHELGHLLLPLADAHSGKGIMKAQLDGNDLAAPFSDSLSFSSKESELMRNEIQHRSRLEEMAH
jgi:hypothetical protein